LSVKSLEAKEVLPQGYNKILTAIGAAVAKSPGVPANQKQQAADNQDDSGQCIIRIRQIHDNDNSGDKDGDDNPGLDCV
jgi:hypothetical protein